MKKSLIFWLAVSVCTAWILVGCEQEAKTEYVTQKEMIHLDVFAADDEELAAYLKVPGNLSIGLSDVDLTGNLTIPAGKLVYVLNSSSDGLNPASSKLTVEGQVYVGVGGTLKASASGVVAVTTGTVHVVKGGTLSVDTAASVNDGAAAPATVLGTAKVGFASETALTLSGAGNDVAAVKAALGYFSNGTLNASASTAVIALKPSEAVTNFGGLVSAAKNLVITANATEDAATLSIPAGLLLITDEAFSSGLTTLTVNGGLAAPSGTFDAVTTLAVNGTLTSIGTFDALATVTGTGSVTAAVVDAGTAKYLIESTLTEVTLESAAITDADGLTIPANTVRVFTGAAVPSAAVTVNGTAIFRGAAAPADNVTVNGTVVVDSTGSLAVTASKQITVGANGSVTAGLIALGPGTWKASNIATTIEESKITLGNDASAKFGKDGGTSATVLTGTATATNTFTASGGMITLGQSTNKLTITGSVAGATLTTGATAGITTKGNLDITTVLVDVSANSTSGIVLANTEVVTLSNSDSVIKTNSGTAENTYGIDGLTIGSGVTVKAAAATASQVVGSITGSASNNTLTATKGVSLNSTLTTKA